MAFGEAEGVTVAVLEVPFDKIRDHLSTAGPAGEGPDIIIGAHDWLGELVTNGVVAPIDLGAAADLYAHVAVKAFTYDGALYGVPYAIENIALIRNTELVPEAPATFEELEATALALQADGTVDVPLALQQDPADPYHNYPLFSALGGYVFGQNEDGTYDADDLGIDSPGGLAAAQKFADWSNEGLISKDVSYDIMIEASRPARRRSRSPARGPSATSTPPASTTSSSRSRRSPVARPRCSSASRASCSRRSPRTRTSPRRSWSTTSTPRKCSSRCSRPVVARRRCSAPSTRCRPTRSSRASALPASRAPRSRPSRRCRVWESWTDAYSLIFTGTDPVQAFTDAAAQIREKIAEG